MLQLFSQCRLWVHLIRIRSNGEPWELLNGGAITYYAARITNRSFATEAGIIPPRTLGFTISRWIYGGMHEDLDITNNSMNPVKFQPEIAIRWHDARSIATATSAGWL